MSAFKRAFATGVALAATSGMCMLGAGVAHAAPSPTTSGGNGDCQYGGQTYANGTIAKDISNDTELVCGQGNWYAIIPPQDQAGNSLPGEA